MALPDSTLDLTKWLAIAGSDLQNETLTMDIIFGQSVKEIKNISGKTFTLYRDNLPGGIYFMRLIEGQKIIAAKKLVITD